MVLVATEEVLEVIYSRWLLWSLGGPSGQLGGYRGPLGVLVVI